MHIDAAEPRLSAAVVVDVDVRTMQSICGGSKDGRKMMHLHFLQYLLLLFEHHDAMQYANNFVMVINATTKAKGAPKPPKSKTQAGMAEISFSKMAGSQNISIVLNSYMKSCSRWPRKRGKVTKIMAGSHLHPHSSSHPSIAASAADNEAKRSIKE
jgi:hypothetical protein